MNSVRSKGGSEKQSGTEEEDDREGSASRNMIEVIKRRRNLTSPFHSRQKRLGPAYAIPHAGNKFWFAHVGWKRTHGAAILGYILGLGLLLGQCITPAVYFRIEDNQATSVSVSQLLGDDLSIQHEKFSSGQIDDLITDSEHHYLNEQQQQQQQQQQHKHNWDWISAGGECGDESLNNTCDVIVFNLFSKTFHLYFLYMTVFQMLLAGTCLALTSWKLFTRHKMERFCLQQARLIFDFILTLTSLIRTYFAYSTRSLLAQGQPGSNSLM
ncbi:uncharacterized protein LOC134844928 [Symsagittifera roscoffensis]|uniref:uncharacterized protein LOC134844928 n=1 Tax=Symsagittifera roscoffensis TaxID=84072 RepID=UPI00307B2F02